MVGSWWEPAEGGVQAWETEKKVSRSFFHILRWLESDIKRAQNWGKELSTLEPGKNLCLLSLMSILITEVRQFWGTKVTKLYSLQL